MTQQIPEDRGTAETPSSLPRNIQVLKFLLDKSGEKAAQFKDYLSYTDKLLVFGSYLTATFYTIFVVQMYLGDPLLWASYFEEATSAAGFIFLFLSAVAVGIFLSKVKHLAYLRLGFAAQVGFHS